MQIEIYASVGELAQAAAEDARTALQQAIAKKGRARLIAATGSAQFVFLDILTAMPGIDWKKVELFHLDEYFGISTSHPASFCRFLRERLIDKTGIPVAHLLEGTAYPEALIENVTAELRKAPIDVAFIGIGENGHLAFNDPPADFETQESFIVVDLDDACRKQQLGEGWFPTLDSVPRRAISMTVSEMLRAKKMIAIVPERRKAEALALCFEGEVSPMAPASILRTHLDATLYLDAQSASLLSPRTIETYKG